MKKKVLSILVIVAMIAMVAACGNGNGGDDVAGEDGYVPLPGGGSNIMYVITPSHANPFFKTAADVAQATAEALGYDVISASHDDDPTRQLELINAAIADGAAAIILDNAGADVTIEAVQLARDAGIPTFLIDREINADGVAISQIVANNYQGGLAIAQVFVDYMGGEGEFIELVGRETDTNAHVRSEAFHEILGQYEDMVMVARQSANWDQTEAFQVVTTLLHQHPNVRGIISGNDTMAVGAAAAVRAAGLSDIIIVGVDGSDDAADEIRAGYMVGTALQQIALIAEMAVRQAHDYLTTGTTGLPERQLVDCIAITIDNVDYLREFVFSPPN